MTHTTNNTAATHELSDQDLDTVNGGFVWLVAAAVAGYVYGATHPIK